MQKKTLFVYLLYALSKKTKDRRMLYSMFSSHCCSQVSILKCTVTDIMSSKIMPRDILQDYDADDLLDCQKILLDKCDLNHDGKINKEELTMVLTSCKTSTVEDPKF